MLRPETMKAVVVQTVQVAAGAREGDPQGTSVTGGVVYQSFATRKAVDC